MINYAGRYGHYSANGDQCCIGVVTQETGDEGYGAPWRIEYVRFDNGESLNTAHVEDEDMRDMIRRRELRRMYPRTITLPCGI